MTRRLCAVGATAVILTLAGCAATESTPAPTIIRTESARTDQETRFLSELAQIEPALAENPDRALRRAGNVCLELEQGKDTETVVDNARERYSSGTVSLSQDQARRIVDAARGTVC